MRKPHPPSTPLSARGLSLQPNFQKGEGLTGPQLLERVAEKEGSNFFQRGNCNFHTLKKLKSEIFNSKKKLITKNNSLT